MKHIKLGSLTGFWGCTSQKKLVEKKAKGTKIKIYPKEKNFEEKPQRGTKVKIGTKLPPRIFINLRGTPQAVMLNAR